MFWALINTLTLKKGAITGEILRRTLATLNYFDVWILLNYGSVYTILTKVSWEILRPFFLQQCFFGVEKYRAFKQVQKLSYIPCLKCPVWVCLPYCIKEINLACLKV